MKHARIIYRAADEVLLIDGQRKAAPGSAGQIIGRTGVNQRKSPLPK